MVDSSLAAMQFMLAARAHDYDTNPIAGYDAKKAATAQGQIQNVMFQLW